jgi:hypothetical protein
MNVQRPVGIIVAAATVAVAGASVVWFQADSIVYERDPRQWMAALCFLVAALGGIVASVGVWMHASWARAPLALWILGTVAGLIVRETLPLDAGVLKPIAFTAGPQTAIAWYLTLWLRRSHSAVCPPPVAPATRAIPTPLLLLLGILGPPIMTLAALVLIAILPGDARIIPYVVLPMLLLGFVVVLSRRSPLTWAKVAFGAIAFVVSLLSLLLMVFSTMVK